MGGLLEERRKSSSARIDDLRKLTTEAATHCGDIACVYATGSFGRREASKFSDLDLFIAGEASGDGKKRALSNLNEIMVKADLIAATRKLGFPEFSGDGEYLQHYTVHQLVDSLGKPDDDVKNTFTARLLLLLESFPLIGEAAYKKIIETVVIAYWRDYEGHKNDFMPAYLANDILRMWRTFCVNYEARTKTDPPEQKAKRKLKNYKLKHSRLLTCYSALMYLSTQFKCAKTVSPTDVVEMISLTPTQRVEWMLSQAHLGDAHENLRRLLELYERFLESTDAHEEELVKRFMDKEKSKGYFSSQYDFGDTVFKILQLVGGDTRFHRLLLV